MMIRGKSVKSTVVDIAEGFTIVNPLFLKPLDNDTLKELYQELSVGQASIRRERFPHSEPMGIRSRNMRLQRLYSASMVIRNYAKQKRIILQ